MIVYIYYLYNIYSYILYFIFIYTFVFIYIFFAGEVGVGNYGCTLILGFQSTSIINSTSLGLQGEGEMPLYPGGDNNDGPVTRHYIGGIGSCCQ